jgi:hypothetical protein
LDADEGVSEVRVRVLRPLEEPVGGMSICGNRTKNRAYYRRRRTAAT